MSALRLQMILDAKICRPIWQAQQPRRRQRYDPRDAPGATAVPLGLPAKRHCEMQFAMPGVAVQVVITGRFIALITCWV